jgi:hypothetical protein
MLNNIRKSDKVLRALTNGGHQDSNMVGIFPNPGEVWYNGTTKTPLQTYYPWQKYGKCAVLLWTPAQSHP